MVAGRAFFKCRDCLAVMAFDGGAVPAGLACECGGRLKFMGRVRGLSLSAGDRLIQTYTASACDGRCTNAPGPSCDCSCGGANHGSRRVVEVEVDAGGVPRLRSPNAAAADTYRTARAFAIAAFDVRYPGVREDRKAGVRVRWDLRRAADDFGSAFVAACKIKHHGRRLAALSKLAEDLTGGKAAA